MDYGYGYSKNDSFDEEEERRQAIKIYAHEASDKLEKLVALVTSHVDQFRSDVPNDRLTVLCENDDECQTVFSELCRRSIKTGVMTGHTCQNNYKLMNDVWDQFYKKEINVVVVNTNFHEDSGLQLVGYYLFADASFKPEVFSELLCRFEERNTKPDQKIHVHVIVLEDDPLKSLETLELEIERSSIPVPKWLSLMISEKSRKRSRDSADESSSSTSSSSTEEPPLKRPKTLLDLKPDKNGVYYCPKYLLRIPKENGDYSDDDEGDDLQDALAEGEPPQFD